ncbi:MAG TPA: patatin-like phospholipase family protein [Streptosporangiaceae bacterium]|nr:patatin-like phospholipase family protein [Streptosporangiaceae bacterium]
MTDLSAPSIAEDLPAVAVAPAPAGTGGAEKPADLVLEGGGVKGIGLAGAVLELDQAGYRFQRVAGTSAGAIAAAIIAALNRAGQPISKLHDYLQTVQYEKFMAKSRLRAALGGMADAEQLLLHMGMYDGDYLVDWLGGVLKDIGVVHFGDLRLDDPGADSTWTQYQRYSLVVHTSDITRGKLVRLPWDYNEYQMEADHERIVDAVRASMSIPFFFEPVRIRVPSTGTGPVASGGRVTWVDGGLLDNFPVDVFDRADGAPSRWPTIGIKLSARQTSIAAIHGSDNVAAEAIACLETVLDNASRFYVTPDSAARTIFVDNGGIKATDFGLTTEQQQMLFDNGQNAARRWLANPSG